MQYSHIYKFFKTEDYKAWAVPIKLAVFFITGFFIVFALQNRSVFVLDIYRTLFFKQKPDYLLLVPVFILLPVNWGLEALKWKFLVSKNEKLSFLNSFRGVLSGITLGFITPNGIGDYAGRLFQLKEKNRMKNIGFLFLNRMAQLQITLLTGAFSVIYLLIMQGAHPLLIYAVAFMVFCVNLVFILLIIFNRYILVIIRKSHVLKFVYPYFSSMKKLKGADLYRVVLYSALRYFVFSLQFVLLLIYYDLQPNLPYLFMGIAFIFMAKSILPSFFDFGVREAAAIYFFSDLGQEGQVLAASIALWLINILIPTLLGLFTLPGLRIFVR